MVVLILRGIKISYTVTSYRVNNGKKLFQPQIIIFLKTDPTIQLAFLRIICMYSEERMVMKDLMIFSCSI